MIFETGAKVTHRYEKGEVGVKETGTVLAFDDERVGRPDKQDRIDSGLGNHVPVMWHGQLSQIPVWYPMNSLRSAGAKKQIKRRKSR
jgi:hypothetical protein